MTNEEKYTELLKELAELLKSKNDKIAVQKCIIDGLETRLAEAEKQINDLKGSYKNEI